MTTSYKSIKSEKADRSPEDYRSNWTDLRGVAFCQDWVYAGDIWTRVLHAGKRGAPGVIMIPGTGGHAETFVGNLGAHAKHFDTYIIDMLGAGYTDKPDYDYDTFAGSKFLLDFMKAVGLEKASFVGVSVGSRYSLRFATEHPDRVEHLTMVSPQGGPGHTWPSVPQPPAGTPTTREAATQMPTWENAKRILTGLVSEASLTDDIIAARLDVSRQPGAQEAMKHILWYNDPEKFNKNMVTVEELDRIKVPVLCVLGSPTERDMDRLKPMTDALADATVVTWSGVGHWPHWEDPDTFNAFNIEFLTTGKVS